MASFHCICAAAVLAVAALGSAKAATIVKDGGFETPVVPVGNLNRYSNGQTIGPWTVVGASGNVDLISSTFVYEGVTFTAHSGQQWLDLTGASQTATGVVQTLHTKAGSSYTLTFYVGTVYDPNGQLGIASTVQVLINGKQVLTAKNAEKSAGMKFVWKQFTTTVVAKSSRTTLEFLNADPPNDTCNGIDDVSLVAKP